VGLWEEASSEGGRSDARGQCVSDGIREDLDERGDFRDYLKTIGSDGGLQREGHLVGVITDGDLRRALERFSDLFDRETAEVMTKNQNGSGKMNWRREP